MKVAPLAFSFLLFAFITRLPLSFSDDVEPVLDSNSKPLSPDGKYVIVPVLRGPGGGGLRLGKTGKSKCPVTILQDYLFFIDFGIPVRFSMPGTSILTGTALDDIEFIEKPNCVESSKWIVLFDNDIEKAYVGVGVPEDHPGKQTLRGSFKIQKISDVIPAYKLVFCVSDSLTCYDVGRYDNREGGNRLILTKDEPAFQVLFGDASYSGIKSVV